MNREKLIGAGINYDEGANRLGGNTIAYEKFLLKFFNEGLMENLKAELEDKKYEEAFHNAHTLKGNAGNLSINDCAKAISVLTEGLRHGNPQGDVMEMYSKAEVLYEKAKNAVEE